MFSLDAPSSVKVKETFYYIHWHTPLQISKTIILDEGTYQNVLLSKSRVAFEFIATTSPSHSFLIWSTSPRWDKKLCAALKLHAQRFHGSSLTRNVRHENLVPRFPVSTRTISTSTSNTKKAQRAGTKAPALYLPCIEFWTRVAFQSPTLVLSKLTTCE